jgi:predicted NBD/HSP70 family sugar kinase/biotin operon repressor
MLTGTNLTHAKRHNLQIVHETVRLYAPISRADVARRTGLTAQTISNLIRQLVDAGLVVETARATGSRGAPPIHLEVNPDAAFAVGLDLDTDHLTAILVDLSGAVRARIHHEAALSSPTEALDLCVASTEALVAQLGLPMERVWGLGVGIPGPMRPGPDGTYLVSPLAFAEWDNVPLAEQLHARLGLPVFIENNATAAAVGEHWYGAGRHLSTFFYVYVGSGLGGGLVVQGTPFEGHTGNAGEIGYLSSRAGRGPGVPTHVGELFNLANLYRRLRDAGADASTPDDLLALHDAAHPTFEAWFEEAAAELASLLYAVIAIVDPEATFVGGRWPDRLLADLLTRARHHLGLMLVPGGLDEPALRLATAGADAGALGVASLPLYHAFAPLQRASLRRADSTDGRPDSRHDAPGDAFERAGVH